jgi:hypothetical protein
MSSTTKNVKNRVSQPDPKNFIEKKVEIPEVLKAQQPPPEPAPVVVRKLEKPQPVPTPVAEVVKTTPVAPPKIEEIKKTPPEKVAPPEIREVKKTPPEKVAPPKVKIVIKSKPPVEEVEKPVPVPEVAETADYKTFMKTVEAEIDKEKVAVAAEIEENGEELVREMEARAAAETVKKYEFIPYILKHSKETRTAEELLSYNTGKVKAIYLEIKEARRSRSLFAKIGRFFKFLFNMQ